MHCNFNIFDMMKLQLFKFSREKIKEIFVLKEGNFKQFATLLYHRNFQLPREEIYFIVYYHTLSF